MGVIRSRSPTNRTMSLVRGFDHKGYFRTSRAESRLIRHNTSKPVDMTTEHRSAQHHCLKTSIDTSVGTKSKARWMESLATG
jgi:hypothetical protein